MLNLSSLVGFFVLGVIGWAIYKIFIWPLYISPLRKVHGPPSENILFGNFKTLLSEEVILLIFFNWYFINSSTILYIYIYTVYM
jgi:hypothetical protein